MDYLLEKEKPFEKIDPLELRLLLVPKAFSAKQQVRRSRSTAIAENSTRPHRPRRSAVSFLGRRNERSMVKSCEFRQCPHPLELVRL